MVQGVGAPRQVLVVDDISIRRQPPIVGDYCNVPRSGRAEWECGHRAETCRGAKHVCPRCKFGFCEYHFPTHVRTFYAPPDAWNRIMHELWDAMRAVAAKPESPIRAPRLTEEERREFEALLDRMVTS